MFLRILMIFQAIHIHMYTVLCEELVVCVQYANYGM